MEDKLPTEQQLKTLVKNKGRDVLVWYVWRNTLRTLPLLGKVPLIKIWPKDTLKHTIAICRIPLLLANYKKNKYTYLDAALRADAAASIADTDFFDIVEAVAEAVQAVAHAFFGSFSNDYVSIYSSVRDSFEASASAVISTDPDTNPIAYSNAYSAVYASADSDYDFLLHCNKPTDNKWFSQPLWTDRSSNNKKLYKPLDFDRNCQNLSDQLTQLGLGFIADDLNLLWQNIENPIQPHWKNYSQRLSAENYKSAASFKAVILEKSFEINAVRVLLLGSGGAGKTTLAHRLQNKNIPKHPIVHKATIGIDYLDHQPLDLYSKTSAFTDLTIPNKLQLYLWDFGGQTLFYGLHKSFLHENCVYVVVVDNRHEQAPDEWLQQINHLVGQTSSLPILIVSNEYENCRKPQNEQRLQREYPQFKLQFFYFSCFNAKENHYNYNKSKKDFLAFKQQLLKTAANSRYLIAQNLLHASKDIDRLFLKKAVIEGFDLEDELAQYIEKESNFDTLMNQLEGLGRLINMEKLTDGERYCLNPAWVVDHAYHLLYLDGLKKSDGMITRKQLKREAWQYFAKRQRKKQKKPDALAAMKLKSSNIDDLLNFLQQSRVCKVLQNKQFLFFPDLAAANEPEQVQQALRKQDKLLGVFEFHLPYLPISLAAHLVCRWLENSMHSKVVIESIEDVWCEGFILRHQDDTNHFLIVQYQSRKAVLLVHCFAKDEYLSDLLEAIWRGLIKEIHPIPAKQLLLFVGIKQGIAALRQNTTTSITTNTAQTAANHQELLTRLSNIEAKMGTNNTINVTHSTFKDSQLGGIGDHNKMTQNTAPAETITHENRAEIALRAIQAFRQEKTFTKRQDLQILEIEIQIEENRADDNLYQRLGIQIGTVANLATIGGAVAALVGLV